MWLVVQFARYGKPAVIICRCGGIGDVLCTLPVCEEVRRRHPGKLLVFITAPIWREVIVMSRCADLVYSNRWWVHPSTFPTNVNFFGLIERIYNPQTTGERLSQTLGMDCHLVEDLAASLGLTVKAGLPKLCPSTDLIEKTRADYGLHSEATNGRLLIGINPGPNWPVKEWESAKWQNLINRIHSEYHAVIIQFGINRSDGSSDYKDLAGVKSVAGQLKGEELVALIVVCDLIVSIDSGPMHVAGAMGVPAIGLFGALNPGFVLPRESPVLGLFADVPCLFCHNRTPVMHWITGCPNDIACMKNLDVETVFQNVKSMLARSKRQQVTDC